MKNLANNYHDISIKEIFIASGILAKFDDIFSQNFAEQNTLIVCDDFTYAAAKQLSDGLGCELFNFGTSPKASLENIDKIPAENFDFLLAVGSGTINDLCKYASYKARKGYAVFATAASMNGYASSTASLIKDGVKQSFSAQLPQAIYFDLGVIAAAPARLNKSGFGDLICRSTAQADWLLSHLLKSTYYNKRPFEMLKETEKELLENSELLNSNYKNYLALLCETLVTSGLGMHICGGSYPASQGEHVLAHYIEAKYGDRIPHSYHGEQIGVTTLIMAEIQEKILSSDQLSPEISEKIKAIRLEKKYLQSCLQKIAAPTNPKDLGWDENMIQDAIKNAYKTRDRFGFLNFVSF